MCRRMCGAGGSMIRRWVGAPTSADACLAPPTQGGAAPQRADVWRRGWRWAELTRAMPASSKPTSSRIKSRKRARFWALYYGREVGQGWRGQACFLDRHAAFFLDRHAFWACMLLDRHAAC